MESGWSCQENFLSLSKVMSTAARRSCLKQICSLTEVQVVLESQLDLLGAMPSVERILR